MYPPNSLQDQEVVSRKRVRSRRVVYGVLLLSLGLNVYFFAGEGRSSTPWAKNMWSSGKPEGDGMLHAPAREEIAAVSPAVSQSGEADAKIGEAGSSPEEDSGNEVVGSAQDSAAPHVRVQQAALSVPDPLKGREVFAMNLKIRNSLTHTVCKSISEEGGCEPLSAHIARLLAWFFDIGKSMRNGDDMQVIYERLNTDEQFRILKLVYQSRRFDTSFEANYYELGNRGYGAYFDQEGKEISQRIQDSQSPIRDYIEITSLPGDFRSGRRGHSGTDFKADVGTPVFSSFEGKVLRTTWNFRNNGYCIELDHPREGVKTRYLHLSRILVKRGQYVQAGDQIAESGNTGRTFAPHLHYEIVDRDKGRTIFNPFEFKYINSYHRRLSETDLLQFRKVVQNYNSILQSS
ncbi:MAG: hypothetical protein COV67_10805 [Nitrospinae bacterium CG11_big_fil_rev_8_21_14_0_20_56_8]|nr:MAG: hypothetical protein COV67_10805 [Nitrospinae bacterium CG11_big_fil_rev_8_21_14_0_20_56_8]